jgi:hypothetical protein
VNNKARVGEPLIPSEAEAAPGTTAPGIPKTDLLLGTTGVESNGAVTLLSQRNASVVVLPADLAGLATGASRRANRSSDL